MTDFRVKRVEDHGLWRGHRTWTVHADTDRGPTQFSIRGVETREDAEAAARFADSNRLRLSDADRENMRRANTSLGAELLGRNPGTKG